MLSYGIFLIIFSVGGVLSGYSGSSQSNSVGGGGGNGYGFSGSFSGGGPPPSFPGFPGFNFPGFLNTYLDSFQKYHQQFINTKNGDGGYSYSFASSSPTASAQSMSSLTFDNLGAQAGYGAPGGFPAASGFAGGYGGGFGNSDGTGGSFGGSFGPGGFGGNGASASASFGPGGIHQTANVYPEGSAFPNVNTRFGGTPGNGFHSVFTSSSSHTTNVNGQPQTVQQAQTTVNDNGKITTYTARNP